MVDPLITDLVDSTRKDNPLKGCRILDKEEVKYFNDKNFRSRARKAMSEIGYKISFGNGWFFGQAETKTIWYFKRSVSRERFI